MKTNFINVMNSKEEGTFMNYSLSPCCGSKVKFLGMKPNPLFSCKKCREEYKPEQLIRIEEWKNKHRTELIDKILY